MRNFRFSTSRGFTLTELALGIGIIGLILGAIWSAAASVYQTHTTQKARMEVLLILEGYRNLYGGHPLSCSDWTDITPVGMTTGLFPQNMIATGQDHPVNPWGGQVYVYAVPSRQGLIIQYNYLSSSACIDFANTFVGLPDVMWGQIDNEQRYFPPLGTETPFLLPDIPAACRELSEGNDYARFMFGASS